MKKFLIMFALVLTAQLFATEDAQASSCRADMVNRNNRVVDSFYGNSYGNDRRQACQMARRQCTRTLRRMQDNGRRLYARCVVNGNGGGHQDRVRRNCTSYKYGPRGRFLQSYNASAMGRRGTGVKQQACRNAMRQCRRDLRGRQYCQKAY